MMNTQQLAGAWDHLRQVHGIGVRLIEAIPAEAIGAHPIRNMRTPRELVVHVYAQAVREIAEGVLRGNIAQLNEAPLCDAIATHADLVRFAKDQWSAADVAVRQITDAHLAAIVPTPWEFAAPGGVLLGLIPDEYLHHRGQLYAYVRALGATPPAMWDFENNAPEYRPRQGVS